MTRLRWASAWRRSRRRWGRGLWDDSGPRRGVSGEHSRASKRLESFKALEQDVEDLDGLVEMAAEEESLQGEVDEQIASVESRLAALEEQRLFSGPYDAGDALVSVNAGAGGTDAQDWAEMVLRMEMRWAERRGFQVELLEASAGEEAGIKSATFRASGENAYGLFGAERGCTGSSACLRSTPPIAARRASPASRSRRSSRTPARSRSTTTTCRSTPTAPRAPAASTSTRPTRPCGSRTGPPGSSCSARTSARSPRTARPRWRCCARSCSSATSANARRRSRARRGEAQDVNFGSQIRSYVLHPYTMVKDHRTGQEMGDVQRVLDGDLDGFVRSYLLAAASSGG